MKRLHKASAPRRLVGAALTTFAGFAAIAGSTPDDDCPDCSIHAEPNHQTVHQFTAEELEFLEWLNSQTQEFWHNGLFDYGLTVVEGQITSATIQDPEGKPKEKGKTKGQPVPEPTSADPCKKKYTTKVQTTMWIDDFDADEAHRSFLGRRDLFPTNQHPISRIFFNELVNATNELADTGKPTDPDDWEKREFRAAADLSLDIGIENGSISGLQATLGVRGGPEPTPFGAYHGTVKGDFTKFEVGDAAATIEYVLYGRPHTSSRFLFGPACAGARDSEWIWHHVRVEITTDGCGGYTSKTTFLGDSMFPSDSIYQDGKPQPGSRKQGNFTNLWLPTCPQHGANLAGAENYVASTDVCTGLGHYVPPLPANPESQVSDASSK